MIQETKLIVFDIDSRTAFVGSRQQQPRGRATSREQPLATVTLRRPPVFNKVEKKLLVTGKMYVVKSPFFFVAKVGPQLYTLTAGTFAQT